MTVHFLVAHKVYYVLLTALQILASELDSNVKETGLNKMIYRHTREVIYNVGKFVKGR
jgi:hypothetical protein